MRDNVTAAQHQHFKSNFNFNLSAVFDVNFCMTQKRKAYYNEWMKKISKYQCR
jgi:hypothetical protein